MSLNLQQEREQAHAMLDRLPPAELGAVRSLLEVMVDDDDEDDEEISEEDRVAIQAGLDSLNKNGGIPMEDVLADFGLTMADFKRWLTHRNPLPGPMAKRVIWSPEARADIRAIDRDTALRILKAVARFLKTG